MLPPDTRVAKPLDARELGEAAIAAFARCKPAGTLPIPRDWDVFAASALRAFGLASWKDLATGAFNVVVDLADGWFIIRPRRTIPFEGGFMALDVHKDIRLPEGSSVDEIGRAILRAFDECEVGPPTSPLPQKVVYFD